MKITSNYKSQSGGFLRRSRSSMKARIKRITATTSKTAVALLSAVIVCLGVSVAFFKSVRFFCWEHPGILIVVIAVAGEVICDWNRKKTCKERLKKFFGILLVLGLLLEITEAVKSDKKTSDTLERAEIASREAGQAKERAENTEATNLQLQVKLRELDVKAADRNISPERIEKFIKALGNCPRGPILVGQSHPDPETVRYGLKVSNMLTNAGFTIASAINYNEDLSSYTEHSDILIRLDTYEKAPPYGVALQNAFTAAGFYVSNATNNPNRPYSPNEAHPNPGEVLIMVGAKP